MLEFEHSEQIVDSYKTEAEVTELKSKMMRLKEH